MLGQLNSFSSITMMWPFSPHKDDHLGIDIGTTSIKIVEIAKYKNPKSGSPRGKLINYGILNSTTYIHRKPSNLAHVEGVALLESEVIAMLQQLLRQFTNHPKEVIMSLPAFSSFVDEVALPPMPPEEIASAIAFEARSHVPVPITEVELTWQVTTSSDKGSSVTIIAVPREIIFRYRSICAQLGLTLKALEVETFSIIRSLNIMGEEPVILLDIGARNTNVSLVAKGLLRASHNIETSGRDITNVIAQGLGVAPRRAEELKRDQGLALAASNPAITDLMYSSIDVIIEEARRMVEAKGMKNSVKRLVLTGGSGTMKGLPEYLQKKLGISIDIASPWATIEYDRKLSSALQLNASSFAVAIGLSLY